jgi:DNA-binding transcriptional MerR regulator
MSEHLTIAEAAARCGLPESTLRYWERIGLLAPVRREPSSRHRRYSNADVAKLETLANLRAVGLSIEDMRAYFDGTSLGDASAGQQRALFQAHSDRIRAEIDAMNTRLAYLDLKVAYWTARERGDHEAASEIADELAQVIRRINPNRLEKEHA